MSKIEAPSTSALPLQSSYTKFDERTSVVERSSTPFPVMLEPLDEEFVEVLLLKRGRIDPNTMTETGLNWVDKEGYTKATLTISHNALMTCVFSVSRFSDEASRAVLISNTHMIHCEVMGLPLTDDEHPYISLTSPSFPRSCETQERPEYVAPLPSVNRAQA